MSLNHTREEEREDNVMNKIKILGKMCIVVIVFIGLLFAVVCTEHTYSKEGLVIDIINEYCVVIEDVNGNMWTVYTDDLHVGEDVLMIMDDNYTKDIYDDMIIDIY